METNARTQRIEAEIPAQLFAEMQELVNAGWFRSVDDVLLDALRRFLDSHREELMEGLLNVPQRGHGHVVPGFSKLLTHIW